MSWTSRFLVGYLVGYTTVLLFGFWPVGVTVIALCFGVDQVLGRPERW